MEKIIRVVTSDVSFGLLKGQLKFLSKYFKIVGVSSPGPNVAKATLREGVDIHTVKMSRHIDLIQDFKSLYNLYKVFKKEKPDMVHSITPKAGLLSMTAAYFARVPIRLHTFTGLIFPYRTGLFQKILITTDRILCFFATNLYPEGEGVKQDLISYKITSKPLKVIGKGNVNGVDLTYYNPDNFITKDLNDLKKELGIEDSDFVFIFLGRLVKDKGINELISAFKKLSTQKNNVKLLLLGKYEHELDPVLPETEFEINTNDNIILAGWQTDTRPYLLISNVSILPSYREGFPNVVLEAGAMGLPCIVTNISGCNEIIKDQHNGVIIPPKDEVKLFEAMKSIVIDKKLVNEMALNSRSVIVNNYERSFVWNSLLKEYKFLLNN